MKTSDATTAGLGVFLNTGAVNRGLLLLLRHSPAGFRKGGAWLLGFLRSFFNLLLKNISQKQKSLGRRLGEAVPRFGGPPGKAACLTLWPASPHRARFPRRVAADELPRVQNLGLDSTYAKVLGLPVCVPAPRCGGTSPPQQLLSSSPTGRGCSFTLFFEFVCGLNLRWTRREGRIPARAQTQNRIPRTKEETTSACGVRTRGLPGRSAHLPSSERIHA